MASGSSTVKSREITLLDSTPARLPSSALFGGENKFATYTAAALAAGALIKMVRLTPGDVVLGGEVYWEAMGSNTAITVGTTDLTNRFMTVCPVSTAKVSMNTATGRFNQMGTLGQEGIGYEATSETDILIACNDQAFTGRLAMVVQIGRPGSN
jgi:hypothetical protein